MESHQFLNVCAKGQIFCPAEQHYLGRSVRSVSCDRCRRNYIEACKGIVGDSIDLCISCVSQIENNPMNQMEIQRLRCQAPAYASTYIQGPPVYIPHNQGQRAYAAQIPIAMIFFPH